MGFKTDVIERALMYGKVQTLDECLAYILPNERSNLMDHKFIPESASSTIKRSNNIGDYCLLCVKKKEKIRKKQINFINETLHSRAAANSRRKSIFGMFGSSPGSVLQKD